MNTQSLLSKLTTHQNLSLEEARFICDQLMTGAVSPVVTAALLTALHTKGETVDEILGFIHSMRDHMLTVPTEIDAIDTCGTGGDGKHTFNISTAVAFATAGAGVPVAKHGNRAASSKSGSADVLEALGINITYTPDQAAQVLQETHMVFLFAPAFHPAMKHVGPVRKELGIRTIFNFLGPFANPARVKRQVIGVPNKAIAEKLAQVATHLHYKHLLIVTSEDGMDEVSTTSNTFVFDISDTSVTERLIRPTDYHMSYSTHEQLIGGEAKENAAIILSILQGEKGPKRDIVVLNAAHAISVAGKAKTVEEGIALAEKSIDSGKALGVLKKLKDHSLIREH